MRLIFFALLLLSLFNCSPATKIYVLRHAEKENQAGVSDVPLSAVGTQHAQALKNKLGKKKIDAIYSTNYVRTQSTVRPLAEQKGITITTYNPGDTSIASTLRSASGKTFVIVGHSNTIDDLINRIMQEKAMAGDLPETQYGDLFILTKRRGRFTLVKDHY